MFVCPRVCRSKASLFRGIFIISSVQIIIFHYKVEIKNDIVIEKTEEACKSIFLDHSELEGTKTLYNLIWLLSIVFYVSSVLRASSKLPSFSGLHALRVSEVICVARYFYNTCVICVATVIHVAPVLFVAGVILICAFFRCLTNENLIGKMH